MEFNAFLWILNIILHGFFNFAITLDFLYNGIEFKKAHLLFILIIGVPYVFVNLCVTISVGEPIYPGMDFVSILSYIELLIALFLAIFSFFAGMYIFKKYKLPILMEKEMNQ